MGLEVTCKADLHGLTSPGKSLVLEKSDFTMTPARHYGVTVTILD